MGKRKTVTVNLKELDGIVDSAQEKPLSAAEAKKLKTALHTMAELLAPDRTTEKSRKVLGREPAAKEPAEKAPGHGRNGADAYKTAEVVEVPHETLTSGEACPECPKGKVYDQKKPRVLLRIVGQAPVQAKVYKLQSLRCNLCGAIFTATQPEGIGSEKYDESVASTVAIFKYGNGIPLNRLESMEKMFGVPFAASTQWELLEELAVILQPVFEQMKREAAQCELVHNDDTGAKVLNLHRPAGDKRTGTFTTGIVADSRRYKIAVFVTGRQHAGENLKDLLIQRSQALEPPIQMADAASRNAPKLSEESQTVLANCLAHGRRHVIDHIDNFPEQCQHILDLLGVPFKNEAEAKRLGLAPKERLKFHKEHSGPAMARLHKWLLIPFKEHGVEPNSGLGQAMKYLVTHWRKLTLFLFVAGAPIDNNICERAIKKAVLMRKNSYFYRTEHGADVGDLFMSLIHTCELNQVNAFNYLTELQKNLLAALTKPADWMPWNYEEQLRATTAAV
jgi:transposase